ncbi:MAG: tRNA lysidine(34) synthetase TilS [Lachnospiraceae bacterium]
MLEKVRECIKKYNMIEKDDRIVCGVSAGPDSVCLFMCLFRLRTELDFELFAVHVNHGIRGGEASRDEEFVRTLANRLGVVCGVYKYDVPSIAAEKGYSLEEAGRIARRIAFEDFSSLHSCNKVALAHNMNDQAETVLLNLCRGTGLAGISGIQPVKDNVIRPLIETGRPDIESFLKGEGIEYLTDSSNLTDEYSRNKIRHHIIPYLENNINPSAVEHISAAASFVRQAESLIKNNSFKISGDCIIPSKDGSVFIKEEAFDEEAASYVVRDALGMLTPHLKDITKEHIGMVLNLAAGQAGKRVSLPYEIVCEKRYEGVLFTRNTDRKPSVDTVYKIEDGTKIDVGSGVFSFNVLKGFKGSIPEMVYTKWVDYDKMKNAVIRTRRTGDRITVGDDGSSKKLSKYLIDVKIPRSERDFLWLVADGNEAVWIPGYRISAGYKVTDETENIMKITFEKTLEREKDE